MDKVQVHYDALLQMINDRDFSDSIIKKEFLSFCQLDKTAWRVSRLVAKIGEARPTLLTELDTLLSTQ